MNDRINHKRLLTTKILLFVPRSPVWDVARCTLIDLFYESEDNEYHRNYFFVSLPMNGFLFDPH